ncbi:hypothetical protein B0H12DRAFT_1156357 [Mycena haematopus]|nr:hypothetical protein B0H12DRAFT_1156357 [Mycena haematopus]
MCCSPKLAWNRRVDRIIVIFQRTWLQIFNSWESDAVHSSTRFPWTLTVIRFGLKFQASISHITYTWPFGEDHLRRHFLSFAVNSEDRRLKNRFPIFGAHLSTKRQRPCQPRNLITSGYNYTLLLLFRRSESTVLVRLAPLLPPLSWHKDN